MTPTTSSSITFVTPKAAAWWGELDFACYRAVMSLTGTRTAGEAFEKLSPTVPEAMAAGGIDLGRDLAGIGMFECNGSPCLYVAAALAHPEKMGDVLGKLLPGVTPKVVAPDHYALDTKGTNGVRTIHVRVVPLDWSAAKIPTDAWSQQGAKASHVLFIGGVDGKNVDVDPLTLLADAPTAAANVKEAESVLADPRGRCMAGLVGKRDFQPGYTLERARFAMAAPPADKPDPMMQLLASQKTLDIEVVLDLSPAPKEADASQWITMGKLFMSNIGQNVRAQFAGQGEMMDVYFDMLSLIGLRAFEHSVKGSSLRLSWRTDRIPKSDLDTLESRLQTLLAP